jgi:hypothetical protein
MFAQQLPRKRLILAVAASAPVEKAVAVTVDYPEDNPAAYIANTL